TSSSRQGYSEASRHRNVSVGRGCISKDPTGVSAGKLDRFQSRRGGSAGGGGAAFEPKLGGAGVPKLRDVYGSGDSMRLLMKKAMPITTRNPPTPIATDVSFDVNAMSTMRPNPTPISVTPARR